MVFVCRISGRLIRSIIGSRRGGHRAFGITVCRSVRFGVMRIMTAMSKGLNVCSEGITTKTGI